MKTVHPPTAWVPATPSTLSRRHFLKGAGVLVGLPLLDAMLPAFARADEKSLVPTRFPSLTLGVNVQGARSSLSCTAGGVLIPCDTKPSEVFKKLFLGGSPEEVRAQARSLALGQSIMDTVAAQTQHLQRSVGARDR